MKLEESLEQVFDKKSFIDFIRLFYDDYQDNKSEWTNSDLDSFISSMERFLVDSNSESFAPIDYTPSWKLFAQVLLAASIYE